MREEIARVVPFYDGIQHLAQNRRRVPVRRAAPLRRRQVPDRRRQGALPRRAAARSSQRAPGIFDVSTRRGKQFNTLIYAEIDPLTGAARDAVFMNPDDAAELHLQMTTASPWSTTWAA